MTRAESRERTRRRLLDAAASSIAERGFAATSVEDISAQAGYTRGAFYSNFSSKSDLFVELLRLDHQNMQENFRSCERPHRPAKTCKCSSPCCTRSAIATTTTTSSGLRHVCMPCVTRNSDNM
ncbi:TetR/AcrR family transcriptional regulator [Paraburkholderia sp. CI2]|uniref:TetR/AcrR family transcriptional regulator n=2 Tax=unclassified Paraburkholderia TaxID=2615204 RepID=UPI0021A69E25|nr:helix-turn-helix domain-containing protein [Paraburkholderia sp. CI2]